MAQACSFPRRREGTQGPGHEGRRYRRPGERRTENGERRTERPYGATGETTIHSFNFWHIADVPGVRGERRGVALPPLPGRGAAPHTPLISESAKIPFVYLCGSSCSSCFPQNTPPLSIAPPVARLSRVPFSVLRSPFSVLRSPFSVLRSPGRLSCPLSARWFGGARRRRSVCWAGRWRRRVRGARAGRWPWPRSEGPVRAFPRR